MLTAGVLVILEIEPKIFNPLFLRFIPKLSHFSFGAFQCDDDERLTLTRSPRERLEETRATTPRRCTTAAAEL